MEAGSTCRRPAQGLRRPRARTRASRAAAKGLVTAQDARGACRRRASRSRRAGRGRRLPRPERRRARRRRSKMLSGLLYPSGGEARVLGFVPSKRERGFLSRITLVMGNRNQLQWDLPALDSYELNRAIYRIPREEFRPTRDELIELLEIGDLVRKPVRQLSLGERMKAEIVGALLHRPQVLFLDEPTIGLDVTMQKRIRGLRRRLQQALRGDRPARRATTWPTSRRCASASSSSITAGSCSTAARRTRRSVRRVQDDRRRARERRRRPLALRGGDPPRRRLGHPARPEGGDVPRHRTPARRGAGARPERGGPADRGRDRARVRAGAPE